MRSHLYKTFLILILSHSLLFSSGLVWAEDTSAISKMSKASATGYVREKDGTLTKTETHAFSGNKGDDDNIMHSLTMLAVGFVGVKLLSYKKWTPDMSTAAIASGLYITSEIMNIINMKKQLNDVTAQTVKRSDGKMDQAQIEALEKLKASYEGAKSAVKMRKNLQLAAAAAFTVAMGIATVKRFTEAGQLGSCVAGIASGLAALQACIVAGKVVPPGPHTAAGFQCQLCVPRVTALQSAIQQYNIASEAPGFSNITFANSSPSFAIIKGMLASECAIAPTMALGITTSFVTPACSSYATGIMLGTAYGKPPAVTQNNELIKDSLISKTEDSSIEKIPNSFNKIQLKLRLKLQDLVDLVIPTAEAGGIATSLGLAGWGATALVGLSSTLTQTVDAFIFTPTKRIFLWGSLALAAKLSSDSSQKEMEKIEENISKIDKILADMYTLQKGITASNVGTQAYSVPMNTNIDSGNDVILFPDDKKARTDCLTPTCGPVPDAFKSMPEFAGLPDSFKSIASQVSNLGNGISGTGTLSGATMSGATALGNNHNAIAKIVGDMKNKLNESLAKDGKAKIDFDKEEKSLWGQMKSGTAKALQERGMSGSSLLSSMGISPISSANAAPAPMAAVAPKRPVLSTGGGVGGGAGAPKGMQLDFKEAPGENVAPESAANLADKNEDLDLGANDINTNSGESIFQLISNRYIKSGYPKLLEEIPVKK